MFTYLHRANWHSSSILTEVFPGFFLIFVLFYVLFVSCFSVYLCVCVCVNVYCITATGWQPNCSLTNISYIICWRKYESKRLVSLITYCVTFKEVKFCAIRVYLQYVTISLSLKNGICKSKNSILQIFRPFAAHSSFQHPCRTWFRAFKIESMPTNQNIDASAVPYN